MMYKLLTPEGETVGYTDQIQYIKVNPVSGCYIQASKEDAQGFAYNGTPYNFHGYDRFSDAKSLLILEVDAGQNLSELEQQNKVLEEQLAETDMAAIYLYETSLRQEVRDAEQDDAIIHIYEMIKE